MRQRRGLVPVKGNGRFANGHGAQLSDGFSQASDQIADIRIGA